jgi:moderate conductance mechanosensitive channel
VDKLGDSGIDIRISGETMPSRQWAVAGELRKRIKEAFEKEGIEMPYPHIKLIYGQNLGEQPDAGQRKPKS